MIIYELVIGYQAQIYSTIQKNIVGAVAGQIRVLPINGPGPVALWPCGLMVLSLFVTNTFEYDFVNICEARIHAKSFIHVVNCHTFSW